MPRQHRQRAAARIGTVLGTQSPFSIFTFPILQICCCGCQSLSQDLTQQASASVACTASTWRWALEWATARKSSAHASAHGGKKRMAAAVRFSSGFAGNGLSLCVRAHEFSISSQPDRTRGARYGCAAHESSSVARRSHLSPTQILLRSTLPIESSRGAGPPSSSTRLRPLRRVREDGGSAPTRPALALS